MPEETVAPVTTEVTPNTPPAVTPAPDSAPLPDRGQPKSDEPRVEQVVNLGGGKTETVNWVDPEFRNKYADKLWMIDQYYTTDEKRMKRAARKTEDLLLAALRGDEGAIHPRADEFRALLKPDAQPAAAAPAPAGSPWATLDTPEVKEELEGSPVLAKALADIKAADTARTQQFAKIATDYKALLDKVEAGEGKAEPLDDADVFNLQADIRDLTRTPHGKALCEKISQEMYGTADVRRGSAVLAQEYAELIRDRANKGEAEPDFIKDIVEPEMRSYNISSDAAPAPKPTAPKPTPPPAAGDLPRGGPGAGPAEVDESKLTAEQLRDRSLTRFSGREPTVMETMRPGGTVNFRRRLVERGIIKK